MQEYLKQLNLKDGKGTWSLILLMFLTYLCACYGKDVFLKQCFFDDNIRHGQWWRLISPSILHDNLGHLIESSCWLIFLGYQLEYFFGTWRFFLVLFFLSIASNSCQYLWNGEPFLGFSAVAIGIGAFLWRREFSWQEKFCFPLFEKLILFAGNLLLCLVAIAQTHELLPSITSSIGRLVEMLSGPPCLHIAHIAHISSALFGWLIGGLSVFQQRSRLVKQIQN